MFDETKRPPCDYGYQRHRWRAPYSIVGGIKENPGVWGKGAGVSMTEVCEHCGCFRTLDTNDNTTTYEPPTEESLEWARKRRKR